MRLMLASMLPSPRQAERPAQSYSGLVPENLTTLIHFTVSSATEDFENAAFTSLAFDPCVLDDTRPLGGLGLHEGREFIWCAADRAGTLSHKPLLHRCRFDDARHVGIALCCHRRRQTRGSDAAPPKLHL